MLSTAAAAPWNWSNPTTAGQAKVYPQAFGTDYPVNDATYPSKSLTITTGSVPAGTKLTYSVTYYPLTVPAVTSFVVDDGTSQRSRVRTFTLAFNTPVTLDSGAVTLNSVVNGVSTPLTYTSSTADGGLTISIHTDRVHSAAGRSPTATTASSSRRPVCTTRNIRPPP